MSNTEMTTQVQGDAPAADKIAAFTEKIQEKAARIDEEDALKDYVFNYKSVKGEQVRTSLKKCNRNIETYILERDLLHDFRFNEFADYAER